MSFKITTTGTLDPVVFNDLGGRSVSHPTIDLDLEIEYTPGEIGASNDIQTALTGGHITVTQDPPTEVGAPVTTQDVGGNLGLPALDGSLLTNINPLPHGGDHEDGGADEINVGGLSGTLADPQPAAAHASSHQHGGADEVATATPAANAIPKADGAGALADGWVPSSAVTQHEADVDHNALSNYDVVQHRVINDAAATTNELWSASKISGEIASLAAGIKVKESVETTTVGLGNITLSGEQTLNGVLTSVDRVLVVEQTAPADNGIYLTDAGAWARTSDADTDAEVTNGMSTTVLGPASTDYKAKYILVTPDPITVGVTAQAWERHSPVEFGTTSGTATEGDDSRVPTQDENNALVGTNGTPATGNPYVTNSDPRNTNARTPVSHAASHQNGGADEISVAGLSGALADAQTPTSHASTHQNGGADEIATATPAANSIPKTAGVAALAAGWLPQALLTALGGIELATQAEVDAGTDAQRAVTPATLTNFIGGASTIGMAYYEQLVDISTTAIVFAVASGFTLSYTKKKASSVLLCLIVGSAAVTSNNADAQGRITLATVPVGRGFGIVPRGGVGMPASFVGLTVVSGLAVGLHTFGMEWRTTAGTLSISSATQDDESGHILILEIDV